MTSVYSQLKAFWQLGLTGTTAKWVMITANLGQALVGALFIGMGLMVGFLENLVNKIPFVNVDWFSTPLYATGVFIVCLTMTGALAAFRELKTVILLYSVIVTLLAVGQIVLVCYGLYQVRHRTQVWIEWAFTKHYLRQPFHAIEANIHCCGAHGPTDYTSSGEVIPVSCCEKPDEYTECSGKKVYKPCTVVLPDYIKMLTDKIGDYIYYAIAVQAIDAITSSMLFKALTPS